MIGDGTLTTQTYTKYCFEVNTPTKFQAGDTAYDQLSAKKGKIEPIFIRKVEAIRLGHSVIRINYIDSLNYLYPEVNLLTLVEAKIVALAQLNHELAILP